MLIADKFVYVHMPKTGGSFVTDTLLQLYSAKWGPMRHLQFAITGRNCFSHQRYGLLQHLSQKHASVSGIPEQYSGLPIIGTVRHPLDLIVSQYEFKWWQRRQFYPYYRRTAIFGSLQSFPDLGFPDFLRLARHAFLPAAWREAGLGWSLYDFVNFYCIHPSEVISLLPTMADSGDALELIRSALAPVQFIYTHQLNEQLYRFLLSVGYPVDSVDFVLAKAKVLPLGRGRLAYQNWCKYYDQELLSEVLRQEKLLFDLLPDFRDC